MTYWLVWVALASVTAMGLIALVMVHRRRRARRTRLRLLSGRGQLLGEEIESRTQGLGQLSIEAMARTRRDALEALDQLHVAAIERQAHLLNYEELSHLLDCKILSLLERTRSGPPLPESPSEPRERAAQTDRVRPARSPGSVPTDRAHLEEELRNRINQLRNPPRD